MIRSEGQRHTGSSNKRQYGGQERKRTPTIETRVCYHSTVSHKTIFKVFLDMCKLQHMEASTLVHSGTKHTSQRPTVSALSSKPTSVNICSLEDKGVSLHSGTGKTLLYISFYLQRLSTQHRVFLFFCYNT